MKIDMHCHTKEGSIDAKVSIEKYIKKLVSEGFDGMLVTDHNSYDGYRHFKKVAESMKLSKPFKVFKGIEYDTRDGGHVIAILPEHINERILEIRGMTLAQLEKFVHGAGGVIGAAHPFGTGFFAFSNTRFGKNNWRFAKKFDFIETFNACTKPIANLKADLLADIMKKPKTAGSDAHKEHIAGSAYTIFEGFINNNTELIDAIKKGRLLGAEGRIIDEMKRDKNRAVEKLGIIGYWLYNKTGALINFPKRRRMFKKM